MLYTFALEYPCGSLDDPDVWYEELDIVASTFDHAKAEALRQANEDYMPGWRRIVALPPGGSGGFVQIYGGAV